MPIFLSVLDFYFMLQVLICLTKPSFLSAFKIQGLDEWEGFLPCLFLEWAFLLGLCGMEWGWRVNRQDLLWGNWETHRGGGLDCEEPWKTGLPGQAVQVSGLELDCCQVIWLLPESVQLCYKYTFSASPAFHPTSHFASLKTSFARSGYHLCSDEVSALNYSHPIDV